MKDPAIDSIRDLLPEFYRHKKGDPAQGGLCTPESGCVPRAGSRPDILDILNGSKPASPAQPQHARKTNEPSILDLLSDKKSDQ